MTGIENKYRASLPLIVGDSLLVKRVQAMFLQKAYVSVTPRDNNLSQNTENRK